MSTIISTIHILISEINSANISCVNNSDLKVLLGYSDYSMLYTETEVKISGQETYWKQSLWKHF